MKDSRQVCTNDKDGQGGVASLMMVVVLSLVFLTIGIAVARTSLVKFHSLETLKNSRHSYYFAESGVEDTLIQFMNDISYIGNPVGEETPIGTYYSTVSNLGNVYDFKSWVTSGNTRRIVVLNITVSYEVAEIATKATYMADFFTIGGEGAKVRGDIWTNDDFIVEEEGIVEGNLSAAGKGSHAVNWVRDKVSGGDPLLLDGRVIDNPETTEVVEGNIVAADTVRVSGPTAYVQGDVTSDAQVYELYGGKIDGNITQEAGLEWNEIPVPSFEFETYKQQADEMGTYFTNATAFENYVDSWDDGEERRLPKSLYYVKSGAVKIYAGTPVHLDGLLVVEDNLYIYSEWYQTAQNGLPAIVCGKDLKIENKFNFGSGGYDFSGPVRINGIVFTEKVINLFRTFDTEDIIVDGAVWAGDDITIGLHTFVNYNLDPESIVGFDFVTGITDMQVNYWQEVTE